MRGLLIFDRDGRKTRKAGETCPKQTLAARVFSHDDDTAPSFPRTGARCMSQRPDEGAGYILDTLLSAC